MRSFLQHPSLKNDLNVKWCWATQNSTSWLASLNVIFVPLKKCHNAKFLAAPLTLPGKRGAITGRFLGVSVRPKIARVGSGPDKDNKWTNNLCEPIRVVYSEWHELAREPKRNICASQKVPQWEVSCSTLVSLPEPSTSDPGFG